MDFNSLFNLHLKFIDYLLAKSHFTHQELKNIGLCGSEIEGEVRNILSQLLPHRYKVTSGYIVWSEDSSSEPVVSPQVDLIIVDTLVPHSLFPVDDNQDVEIVPAEAVVGIFEIKRKMDKKSLFGTKKSPGALKHLQKIASKMNFNKSNKDQYMPTGEINGMIKGPYYGNPMLGVISLTHTKSCEKLVNIIKWAKDVDEHVFDGIDMLFSIDGLLAHTVKKGEESLAISPYRENEGDVSLRLVQTSKNLSRQKMFSVALGIILNYITLTVGRKNTLSKYYFNETVK